MTFEFQIFPHDRLFRFLPSKTSKQLLLRHLFFPHLFLLRTFLIGIPFVNNSTRTSRRSFRPTISDPERSSFFSRLCNLELCRNNPFCTDLSAIPTASIFITFRCHAIFSHLRCTHSFLISFAITNFSSIIESLINEKLFFVSLRLFLVSINNSKLFSEFYFSFVDTKNKATKPDSPTSKALNFHKRFSLNSISTFYHLLIELLQLKSDALSHFDVSKSIVRRNGKLICNFSWHFSSLICRGRSLINNKST